MSKEQTKNKTHTVVTLIGVILLLVGVYAGVRTIVNIAFFDKYPVTGVLSINLLGISSYHQREEDCFYPQTYFTQDGQSRVATLDEKAEEKKQQEICLSGVKEDRKSAKVNDISVSVLFLFLGVGLLGTRRYFFN